MNLLGHDQLWSEWRNALAGPRMHHAWLIGGKRGLGKMQFAMAAARELVGQTMPLGSGGHPDILILSHAPKDEKEEKKRDDGKPYERKRNITVDQIRQMQQRLTTRPTLGDRRAIIIDPADDMEAGASNALLKSLEEPPVGTHFLLVAHRPSRLLPTVRSRCRMLRFNPLSNSEVELVIQRAAPEADRTTIDAAVMAADGAPGAALAFIERGLGRMYAVMLDLIVQGDPHFALRGQLADALGSRPDRDTMLGAIDLARTVLAAQVAKAKRREQAAIVKAHSELVVLAAQAPTYNFDAGLMIAHIGSLLASAAPASERAHA